MAVLRRRQGPLVTLICSGLLLVVGFALTTPAFATPLNILGWVLVVIAILVAFAVFQWAPSESKTHRRLGRIAARLRHGAWLYVVFGAALGIYGMTLAASADFDTWLLGLLTLVASLGFLVMALGMVGSIVDHPDIAKSDLLVVTPAVVFYAEITMLAVAVLLGVLNIGESSPGAVPISVADRAGLILATVGLFGLSCFHTARRKRQICTKASGRADVLLVTIDRSRDDVRDLSDVCLAALQLHDALETSATISVRSLGSAVASEPIRQSLLVLATNPDVYTRRLQRQGRRMPNDLIDTIEALTAEDRLECLVDLCHIIVNKLRTSVDVGA